MFHGGSFLSWHLTLRGEWWQLVHYVYEYVTECVILPQPGRAEMGTSQSRGGPDNCGFPLRFSSNQMMPSNKHKERERERERERRDAFERATSNPGRVHLGCDTPPGDALARVACTLPNKLVHGVILSEVCSRKKPRLARSFPVMWLWVKTNGTILG